ncbi:MAG: hypothetical protein ACD_66C00139G0001 [uncultured bacterium]|nr:MAG: hypothetical protein ACD_66C00139G0001 [uncultured bacterium]
MFSSMVSISDLVPSFVFMRRLTSSGFFDSSFVSIFCGSGIEITHSPYEVGI